MVDYYDIHLRPRTEPQDQHLVTYFFSWFSSHYQLRSEGKDVALVAVLKWCEYVSARSACLPHRTQPHLGIFLFLTSELLAAGGSVMTRRPPYLACINSHLPGRNLVLNRRILYFAHFLFALVCYIATFTFNQT